MMSKVERNEALKSNMFSSAEYYYLTSVVRSSHYDALMHD